MSIPSSIPVFSPRRPQFYVALLAFSVLTMALLIGRTALFADRQQTMVLAVTIDALAILPLIWYLLLVRPGHLSAHSLLPVLILGFIVLTLTVPGSHDLPGLKWVFVALEPILIGLAIWRIRRFSKRVASFKDLALPDRLNRALSSVIGNPALAHMVAMELTVLTYALGFVRRPPQLQSGQHHFTHHRRSGARAAIGALAFICVAEAAVVHLLVQRWNPTVAWILTILSLYAALWLVGYLRSLSLLPSTVGPTTATIRNGLLESTSFDLADVTDLRGFTAAATGDPAYLGLTPPLTEPTHLLELAACVEVRGLFGRRKQARIIGIALDDPTEFEQALGC